MFTTFEDFIHKTWESSNNFVLCFCSTLAVLVIYRLMLGFRVDTKLDWSSLDDFSCVNRFRFLKPQKLTCNVDIMNISSVSKIILNALISQIGSIFTINDFYNPLTYFTTFYVFNICTPLHIPLESVLLTTFYSRIAVRNTVWVFHVWSSSRCYWIVLRPGAKCDAA